MPAPTTERPEILRVLGVREAFNSHPVLHGVNLSLRACQTLSVLGESGAGKSTLLRLIAGLIKPDRGRIFLFGQDITRLRERDVLSLRRRMGVVFQGAALFDSLTVFENVAFPLRLHTKASEREIRARVAQLLERVGLPGSEAQRPAELSGGMKRRVGIARALALAPELVLFDEPTAGLDPGSARMICGLIAELRRDLCETSVVVTHDLQCAFSISDQIAFLHGGRIIERASAQDFLASSRAEVQAFLAGAVDPPTPVGTAEGRFRWNSGRT